MIMFVAFLYRAAYHYIKKEYLCFLVMLKILYTCIAKQILWVCALIWMKFFPT
ncbi:hypothetical protein ACJX0J_034583, partial [Zea mays]